MSSEQIPWLGDNGRTTIDGRVLYPCACFFALIAPISRTTLVSIIRWAVKKEIAKSHILASNHINTHSSTYLIPSGHQRRQSPVRLRRSLQTELHSPDPCSFDHRYSQPMRGRPVQSTKKANIFSHSSLPQFTYKHQTMQ